MKLRASEGEQSRKIKDRANRKAVNVKSKGNWEVIYSSKAYVNKYDSAVLAINLASGESVSSFASRAKTSAADLSAPF